MFEEDVLVICGDGRMDSPGFSAKYCVYKTLPKCHWLVIGYYVYVINIFINFLIVVFVALQALGLRTVW